MAFGIQGAPESVRSLVMGHSTKSKREPPKDKIKEGRPSLYHPEEHPRIARKIMAEGKTLCDLAEALEISRSTLTEWRAIHPEFSAMVDLGQEDAIDRVEEALHARACGYQHASVKVVTVSQGEGMGSVVEQVPITVIYPPDPTAASFFLRNKRGDKWKDKQQVEHVGLGELAERLAESRKRIIEQGVTPADGKP